MWWLRWCVLLALLGAACVAPPEGPIDHRAYEDVRRIVVALDDVRDEYHLAVGADRAVLDPVKLHVLDGAMHDSLLESRRFPAHEKVALRRLAAAVARHAPPLEVTRLAAALRRHLLNSRRLVIAPPAPPPHARAEQLWEMQCAGCHGPHGAGDGPQGLGLDPGPKSFQDEDTIAHLAPTRAFSRLADGLRGTAMPSWGYLTSEERWGLAFLVLTFRTDEDAVRRGGAIAARHAITLSPTWVADRTDSALVAELGTRGLSPDESADVVAFARAEAVFAPTAGPSRDVRAALADAVAAYRARRFADARRVLERARTAALSFAERVRLGDRDAAARIELCAQHLAAVAAEVPLLEIIEREVARCQTRLDDGDRAVATQPTLGAVAVALERMGAAALALALLAVLARRPSRWLHRIGLFASAIGGAALAGRLAWTHWLETSTDRAPLAVPRIELLGLYPCAIAVAVAIAGAALAATAWSRVRAG